MIQYFLKRVMDVLLSFAALILLSPILALVTVSIFITMGAPALYRQVRPGYKRKLFTLYKFRTMLDISDQNGNPLPDAERLTKLGRFIRSVSLDELPQLWNVLKGDLSMVGPRPLLVEYLERYTPEQMRRHDAKPGITGWAQINGRNAINWEEKFALDVWYVDNWSLWLDIKILFYTLWKVLKREGISKAGEATMTPFMGTEKDKK